MAVKAHHIIQLKGPHLKVCECGCEQQFYGRRNQKYIDSSHKSKVNNEKRNQELEWFNPLFDDVRKSYQALVKGLQEVDEKGWVYIGELTKNGFNPDCFTQRVKNENGVVFKRILDMAFLLSEKKDHVQIFKI